MSAEEFNRAERRAAKFQKGLCGAEHPRLGKKCERPDKHTGQHKAKTHAGHAYWSGS